MELAFITQLHLMDSVLCLFVFFPLNVLYWRGIWDLWGLYIDPKTHYPAPQWILLCISTIAFVAYFIAPQLESRLNRKRKLSYFVVSRLYMWFFAAFYMCYWRSLWELVDYFLPSGLLVSVIQFSVTYTLLLVFRSARTCIFAPFYVALDTRDNIFQPATRFNTNPYSWKYFLDSFFSHFIIQGLVIVTWRGLFNVIGHLVFANDPLLSDCTCLGIGYLLAIILLAIEELLANMILHIEKEGFLYKLLLEDLWYTIIFIVTILLWRGAWNLTARYVIADPELGGWVCFLVGSTVLTFLQVFSYFGTHGVVVDGADAGRDAFYPTLYLRHYLLYDYDYYDYDSSKSGTRTPPFPLDNSSFSYRPGSVCTLYDNIGHTNRLPLTHDADTAQPI